MSKVHVKKGDEVYVLSGRDRGKTGKVLEVNTKTGKVKVDGVNIVKKHKKPRPPKDVEGGIKEEAAPIDASNVKLNKDAKAKTKAKSSKAAEPKKTAPKAEAKPAKDSESEPKAEAESKPSAKKTSSKKKAK